MGGDAFLIPVTPSPALLERKPGWLGRLFGTRPNPDELPTKGFHKALWTDFRGFVRERLTAPWPASRSACEYLDTIGWTLYLRRYPEGWFLQVTWTGCAGVAETSAALATHWTRLWWEARSPSIPDVTVDPSRWGDGSDPPFAPVGDVYVAWTGEWEWDEAVEAPPEVSGLPSPEGCACQLCDRNPAP